ncbi:hypothetical protein DA2_1753 [Desulfovibrio sp. A2]|nr:hypothetical protein DA2_1753 [Desulfovibrio sp. A2]
MKGRANKKSRAATAARTMKLPDGGDASTAGYSASSSYHSCS